MKALVCGTGSIGKRHTNNLRSLGVEVRTCDPVQEADYQDVDMALRKEEPDAAFICSPTALHVQQALAVVRKGSHVFIEKPLSFEMTDIEELKQEVMKQGIVCMVGCNMRFHHGPSTIKKILDAGTIGTPKKATIYTGSFLPSWRPHQDYMKSYSADPAQGGAILDCIHEIDLTLWFLGPAGLQQVTKEPATSIKLPQIEGTADLRLVHDNGATSAVHLSFTEPDYRRRSSIEGTLGTVDWDFGRKTVEVRDPSGALTSSIAEPAGYEINRMYVDEVKHFLDCVREERLPDGNLEEALAALRIALEARQK
jgi:predicted dehydrogenase